MNLHSVVRGAIQAVTPDQFCTWQQSTGSISNSDASRTPLYNTVFDVPVQIQGLDSRDLRHIEYLNLEGILRKVYLYGSINGVVRTELMGGDLLVFNDYNPTPVRGSNGRLVLDASGHVVFGMTERVWKVVDVRERWPNVEQQPAQIVLFEVIDGNGNPVVDGDGNIVYAGKKLVNPLPATTMGWSSAIICLQTNPAPRFVTDGQGRIVLDGYGQAVQAGAS